MMYKAKVAFASEIRTISPYRTVNTFYYGYKYQLVNDV
jgi:hypothetical protein